MCLYHGRVNRYFRENHNKYLTNPLTHGIIYHAEILCARLGEDKQLLSLERSESLRFGGLAYTLKESSRSDTPV